MATQRYIIDRDTKLADAKIALAELSSTYESECDYMQDNPKFPGDPPLPRGCYPANNPVWAGSYAEALLLKTELEKFIAKLTPEFSHIAPTPE